MTDNQGWRDQVVAEARRWLGTPYHHYGAVRAVGCDCVQLPLAVYQAVGLIPVVRVGPYPRHWHLHHNDERYLAQVRTYADDVAAPGRGDFMLLKFGRCFAHGAIVSDWPWVIHSSVASGVLEEDTRFAGTFFLAGKARPHLFFSPRAGSGK